MYNIIKSFDLDTLTMMVNESLQNGWECQGGVCAMELKNEAYVYAYFQAMVEQSPTKQ